MKVTFTYDFCQEDMAAMAQITNIGKEDFWAKPTERDIKPLVRYWIKTAIEHRYIASGAMRKEYMEEWRKQ